MLTITPQLIAFLRDEVEPPIVVSDRRLVQAAVSQGGGGKGRHYSDTASNSQRLLKVAAAADGRSAVSVLDLLLLQYVFSHEPEV